MAEKKQNKAQPEKEDHSDTLVAAGAGGGLFGAVSGGALGTAVAPGVGTILGAVAGAAMAGSATAGIVEACAPVKQGSTKK